MSPIEIMYEVYGEYPVNPKNGNYAKCDSCHFFHWKIEGKGKDRHQAYRWCEIYGLNKKDVTSTDWKWGYHACGIYNLCAYPPEKNLYKRSINK